jgi:hypothetical protein
VFDRIRSRLSFANCVSMLALFIALGGTSYAVATNSIGSAQLINNSVRTADLRNNDIRGKDIRDATLESADVKDGALKAADFAAGQIPAGAAGVQGPQGATGAAGAAGVNGAAGLVGPAGADGSPDTAAEVLTKLKTVDGSGSGLDADLLDGKNAADLVGLDSNADPNNNDVPLRFYSYYMGTTGTARYDFGQVAIEAGGIAGQFKICGDTGGVTAWPWVLYLNGVRTSGTVAGNACTAAVDAGVGGDFQVSIRRSIIFGVHAGDPAALAENYNVYGFGQL